MAFSDLLPVQADHRREVVEPFEMGAAERERAAVDAARAREDDAEFVHENLFAGAVALDIGRIEALAKLRLQEQVTEDRELHDEPLEFSRRRFTAREPLRVAIAVDDRVRVDACGDVDAKGLDIGWCGDNSHVHGLLEVVGVKKTPPRVGEAVFASDRDVRYGKYAPGRRFAERR